MKEIRLLKRALALPPREGRQALAAAAALLYASAALKLLPFSKAIALGSVRAARSSSNSRDRDTVSESVRAVERASYAVPWRTVCIHQGLALQLILRRRGIPAILCYGTRQGDENLESHVWVKVGDDILIGGEEAARHHLVAVYPRVEESSTSRPSSSLNT